MGFYLQEPYQAKAQDAAKNRVWGFGENVGRNVRKTAPQLVESHLKKQSTPTKTVSGIPYWLSRDPIGERGGLNLYGFVNNDGVNRWDYLELECKGNWRIHDSVIAFERLSGADQAEYPDTDGIHGYESIFEPSDDCCCADENIKIVQVISYDDFSYGFKPEVDYRDEDYRKDHDSGEKAAEGLPAYVGGRTYSGGKRGTIYDGYASGTKHHSILDAPISEKGREDNTFYLEICALCDDDKGIDRVLSCVRFNFSNKNRVTTTPSGSTRIPRAELPEGATGGWQKGGADPTSHFNSGIKGW